MYPGQRLVVAKLQGPRAVAQPVLDGGLFCMIHLLDARVVRQVQAVQPPGVHVVLLAARTGRRKRRWGLGDRLFLPVRGRFTHSKRVGISKLKLGLSNLHPVLCCKRVVASNERAC
jgi:hypothetical protein